MSTDAQISAAILIVMLIFAVGAVFIWKKLTDDGL